MNLSSTLRKQGRTLLFLLVALWPCGGCQAPAAPPSSTVSSGDASTRIASPIAANAASERNTKSVAAKFEVVATFPHDAKAFTQGLLFEGGVFYESTGLEGSSGVRRVEVKSGRVLAKAALPPDVFGEGLALVGRELYAISWQDGRCFVFDRATLKKLREHKYEGEGWGLTYDGKNLIMSDGSDTLQFRDPKTFAIVRTLQVTEDGESLSQLNELETIGGEIWANVWHSDRIVRIDAKTGIVTSYLDCSALYPRASGGENVLNGIAHDAKTGRVFVTGKLWPKVFALRLQK